MDFVRTLTRSLTDTLFSRVVYKENIQSTNSLALLFADNGEEEGLVVIADSQSEGRGRFDRAWYSPPERNIYMSLLLRPNLEIKDASLLTVLAGVDVCEGLRDVTRHDIRIKWPNDIVFKGMKIGGILIDTKIEQRTVAVAIVGIGINVNLRKNEIPEELKKRASSLSIETTLTYDRAELISAIIKRIDVSYRVVRETAPLSSLDPRFRKDILQRWKALDTVIGHNVSAQTPTTVIRGKATDVDEYGKLLIATDSGTVERLSVGDVSLVA